MNEKVSQILVPISTLVVIFVNFLAATGKINNVSPTEISNNYPTVITPAGYAFTIWSLIYVGMIAFSIYQLLPRQTKNPRIRQIRIVYILNCAANCVWIFLWQHEVIFGALGVICFLLATLVFINVKLQNSEAAAETWLAKIPFSIYFGWVTVATILNFSIALVYLGVRTTDLAAQLMGAILIAAAVCLGILMRFKLGLPAYPLSIAWALTAIAANQGGKTIIVVTSAIAVIILLLTALSFIFDMKSSES